MPPDRLTAARLRLGVVGCGRIAQVAHLPAAAKADGIELTAVCDPSPVLSGAVGRRYDVHAFTELEPMLDSGLDAVVVATPDRLHHEHAVAALEAGKHVLVEKPLAPEPDDARHLGELADQLGLKLQVGAMKRHDPGIEYARAAVERIGPVLTMSSWYRVMAALRPPTEAALFPFVVVDDDVRTREAAYKADRPRHLLTHTACTFSTACGASSGT